MVNIEDELKQLRTKVQDDKLLVGKEVVLKALKSKKLQKVYMASNCPAKLKEDVEYYAKLAEVPIIALTQNNEELGVFCKKNYFVAVVGIE